jgi:hypothetical protein
MNTRKLVDSLTAETFTSETLSVFARDTRYEVTFQAEISSVANVKIQGRVESSLPFTTLETLTESGFQVVAAMSEYRIDVDSNDGQVDVGASW